MTDDVLDRDSSIVSSEQLRSHQLNPQQAACLQDQRTVSLAVRSDLNNRNRLARGFKNACLFLKSRMSGSVEAPAFVPISEGQAEL